MDGLKKNPVVFLKLSALAVGILNISLTADFLNSEEVYEKVYLYIQLCVVGVSFLWTTTFFMEVVKKHTKATTLLDGFVTLQLSLISFAGVICYIVSVGRNGSGVDSFMQKIVVSLMGMLTAILYMHLAILLCVLSKSMKG